jgi:hypothetical protein
MMWLQRKAWTASSRIFLAVLTITAAMLAIVGQGAAGATHPSYPLGKSRSCKVHYVKRTAQHKVDGKEVRYIECVYLAPKPPAPVATTTTTTTTTLAPPPGPTVSLSRESSGQLFTGVGFTILAVVSSIAAPSTRPTGTVTFASSGVPISFCSNEAMVSYFYDQTKSSDACMLSFSRPGTYIITAVATGAGAATGTGSVTITVNS